MLAALVLGTIGGGDSAGGGNGDSTQGILTPPKPPNAIADSADCTKLQEALPVGLKALAPRVVHTQFVVAWGQPAIIASCGVDKPKAYGPTSTDQLFSPDQATGSFYWVDGGKGGNTFTAVDRPAYVSFFIPPKYQGGDYLPILNAAVVKAMPTPVCTTVESGTDVSKFCTRRSVSGR